MAGVVFAAVGYDTSFMAVPLRRLKGEAEVLVVFTLTSSAPRIPDEVGEEGPEGGPYPVEESRYRAPDERLEEAQFVLKEEIEEICSALGVERRIVGVPADSEFESALRLFQDNLDLYRKSVRQFFLSDTTLTVNVAAVTACYLEGVPLHVADATGGGMVPIPIIRMRYDTTLTPHDLRVLEILQKAEVDKEGTFTVGSLADRLGRKKSTLSERLDRLEEFGVVQRIEGESARETRVEILPQGRVLLRSIRR